MYPVNFLFSKDVHTSSGAHPAPYSKGIGGGSLCVKVAGV